MSQTRSSLLQFAHLLGTDRGGGMAQKVALHWPPPPPVSLRNVVELARLRLHPVCHFLDPPGSPTTGIRAYGLKGGGPRKSPLSWNVSGQVNGVTAAQLPGIISRAFAKWSGAAATLSFSQPPSGGVDIALKTTELGAPAPATGNVILGSTTADGSMIAFNTDPAVAFIPSLPGAGVSLLAIATHEIGHALGLLHSTNPGSVMFPLNSNNENLSPEDIAAIRALYGWAPQTLIPGIGTDAAPALCACGSTLVMAWKGIGDDHRIWVSQSSDGLSWTPQRVVPGAGSADGPTLAWDGTTLWLAIRGVPDDDGLYWTTSVDLGSTWSGVSKISGVASSNSPSMTIFNKAPLMVWKGVSGDSGLYFTRWNNAWLPQAKIPETGSADRPAISVDFNGLPRMVWRGIEDDHVLYTSVMVFTSGVPLWQPQESLHWVVMGNGPAGTVANGTPGSSIGPGLTGGGGKVFLVWKGVPGDDAIYFTQAAPGPPGVSIEWSTQAIIDGVGTEARPAIVFFQGRIVLVWKGVRGDHNIFASSM